MKNRRDTSLCVYRGVFKGEERREDTPPLARKGQQAEKNTTAGRKEKIPRTKRGFVKIKLASGKGYIIGPDA